MKRILCVILAMMMLCLCGCGQNVQDQPAESSEDNPIVNNEPKSMDGDFRYSNWGDSIQSVLDAEDIEPEVRDYDELAGHYFINYKIILQDMDADLIYYFDDDKLYKAVYSFTEQHTNYGLRIQEYRSINERLKENYGEPVEEREDWSGNALKNEPGKALWLGFLSYYTMWETDNTKITHTINSDTDTFEIRHMITYQSLDYKPEAKTDGL